MKTSPLILSLLAFFSMTTSAWAKPGVGHLTQASGSVAMVHIRSIEALGALNTLVPIRARYGDYTSHSERKIAHRAAELLLKKGPIVAVRPDDANYHGVALIPLKPGKTARAAYISGSVSWVPLTKAAIRKIQRNVADGKFDDATKALEELYDGVHSKAQR